MLQKYKYIFGIVYNIFSDYFRVQERRENDISPSFEFVCNRQDNCKSTFV
jgi:hypothetical protein